MIPKEKMSHMAKKLRPLLDRITQDPQIMVGKPVVKGTRIPVEKVLQQLAYKPELEELFEIFPELTVEDVRACLAYAQAAVAAKRKAHAREVVAPAPPA